MSGSPGGDLPVETVPAQASTGTALVVPKDTRPAALIQMERQQKRDQRAGRVPPPKSETWISALALDGPGSGSASPSRQSAAATLNPEQEVDDYQLPPAYVPSLDPEDLTRWSCIDRTGEYQQIDDRVICSLKDLVITCPVCHQFPCRCSSGARRVITRYR